jgi:hypothetical protein
VEYFKIKHSSSGLFSTGGMDPRFSSRGKTWRKLSDVILHFNAVPERLRSIYDDCVIVTFEYVLKNTTERSVHDLIGELRDKERARLEARQERYRRAALAEETKEYNRLRAKFENMRGDPD